MTPVLHGLTSEFAHGRAFSEVVPLDSPAVATGFTYTVGGAGRVTQATDPNNNYVMLAKYAPHGALASMTNGSGILHPIPTTTACSLFCFPLL